MFNKSKKISLGALITSVVFISVFGFLLMSPKPAKAQMDGAITSAFLSWQGIETAKGFKETIKEQGLFMVMSALMNGLNYFTNKIAYDMGVWLASGNWGQGPFASGESFGNYMAQVAGDSLGESLGSLSRDLGLNLCDLPDIRLDLMLQLGFHFAYEPPTPKCSWQRLRQAYNIDNIRSQYASVQGLTSRISMGVNVNDTDFGIMFKAKERIDTLAFQQSAGAQLNRQEGDGVFAMTDIISGRTKVPATVMKEEMNAQSAAAQKEGKAADNRAMMSAALQKGGVTIAVNTVSTFVNTLLGTVLNNFVSKGMLPGGKTICNPGLSISGVGWDQCSSSDTASALTGAGGYYSSGSSGSQRRAAQELFSEYLIPKIKTIENFNVIGTMADCSPDNFLPEACTIDQSFLQALQEADQTGVPLTIKQAIERGHLHGDWRLVPPSDVATNEKHDCALSAYCSRNIKFLRLMRILPLGFEIAANLVGDNEVVTLNDVVNSYYSTNANDRFRGLINPYWVIKYPKTRCNNFAYTSVNVNNGMRLQSCVDIQHCVAYNKDGSCANWGYCLREQPIWKIDADYCEAQNNTCKSFVSSDGATGSYLLRTLNTENCDADTDGCARYSRYKVWLDASNQDWLGERYQMTTINNNQIFSNSSLFFNKKMPTCDISQAGCSAFKLASDPNTLVYLKKAPDYLGCYDADGSTVEDKTNLLWSKITNGVQWPQNLSDLNLIRPQNQVECDKYAKVCLPEEENCNYYTSALSGEVIPGKFTPATIQAGQVIWNDQCDAKCVGYAAYAKLQSNYANQENLSYIIPSSGRTCLASESGCTSFTNLSTDLGGLEQNEYFSYLRLCSLPDQNKQRNYSVYESSENGGYQLRTYTLIKNDNNDGPKQIFRNQAEVNNYTCNEATYKNGSAHPDCHQFIDMTGVVHYALLSKTVVVSEQCTPYRLNNTELWWYSAPSGAGQRCPYDFDPAGSGFRAGTNVVEFKDNACYYMGITGSTNGAGDSVSCNRDVDSCRTFKGNTGNNVRTIIDEGFERDSVAGWATNNNDLSVAISTESTQLGGHSLRVSLNQSGNSGSYSLIRPNLSVRKDAGYTISFWLKGNLRIDQISLTYGGQSVNLLNSPIMPTQIWRYYSFGPVYVLDSNSNAQLNFTHSGGTGGELQQFFVDNIRFQEVNDLIHLVENSLSVDPICDSSPNDNLPGEALGCSAYKTPTGNVFNLINFSYLCREDAVGCTAVLDTFNTPDDPFYRIYNLKFSGQSGQMVTKNIGGRDYSCQIPQGGNSCYVNVFGLTSINGINQPQNGIEFVHSTIVVNADTSSTKPIYLVANQNASCKSENMGCEVVGKSTVGVGGLTYDVAGSQQTHYETFTEVAIKNDPALYDNIICQADAVGCSTWTSGESVNYFKDPKKSGNLLCEYKKEFYPPLGYAQPGVFTKDIRIWGNIYKIDIPQSLLLSSVASAGWVWKDVGVCANGATMMNMFCQSDNDCKVVGSDVSGTCQLIGNLPCYRANSFPVYSFGTGNAYKGFVGECPPEQSGCNQFIDHSSSLGSRYCSQSNTACTSNAQCNSIIAGDTCVYLNNKCRETGKRCYYDSDCNEVPGDACVSNEANVYYLIENSKFTTQQGVCNGKVSWAEGCILLDKTANPNKYWNTASSYTASRNNQEGFVSPISNNNNNANIILKVVHDRECAEWAYCDMYQDITNEETGEVTNRCYHLGACNKAGTAQTVVGATKIKDCATEGVMVNRDTKDKRLTTVLYRDLTKYWDSKDFSGYAIYNQFQVPDLNIRNIADDNRLVNVNAYYSSYAFTALISGGFRCAINTANGTPCGGGSGVNTYSGQCYNGECISGWGGGTPETSRTLTCRAYAEQDAPFRSDILSSDNSDPIEVYKSGFEGANLCYNNSGNPATCDSNRATEAHNYRCQYVKYTTTGGGVVYKRPDDSKTSNYICDSGPEKGRFCTPDGNQCGEEGSCTAIKSMQTNFNQIGYCLEKDNRLRINGTNETPCLTWWPIDSPPGSPMYWQTDLKAGYEVDVKEDRFICLDNQPILRESFWNLAFVHGGGDYDDFNFTMPKGILFNGSFPPVEVRSASDGPTITPSQTIGIEKMPENAMLIGCGFRKGEENDRAVWEYLFKNPVSTDGQSLGWWCPISTRSTYIDDATIATCDRSSSAEQCANPSAIGSRWSNQGDRLWTSTDSNARFIHISEIERIDVYFDNADGFKSGGWVSFITDSINIDANEESPRYFVMVNSSSWQSGGSISASFNVQSLDNLCKDNKNWRAWQWRAGGADWTAGWLDGGSSNLGKELLVTKGVCNEQLTGPDQNFGDATKSKDLNLPLYVKHDLKNNLKGLGVRVVWDDNYYLRGVWMNLEDDSNATNPRLGYYFIVHFNQGKCRKFAQVADTTQELSFKPFANRLMTNSANITSKTLGNLGIYTSNRTENLNGGKYGLAYTANNYANPTKFTVGAFSVNPFTPNSKMFNIQGKIVDYSQQGLITENYSDNIPRINAGIPLVAFSTWVDRVNSTASSPADRGSMINSDNLTMDNNPFKQMISSMFAKVYQTHKISQNNPVTIDNGYQSDNLQLSTHDYANPLKTDTGFNIYPPRVAAPSSSVTGGYVLDAISVGEKTSGDIYVWSGDQLRIKFYAWAHGNQMPIRRIILDRGDGVPIDTNMNDALSNRKPVCVGNNICGTADVASQFPCRNDDDCAPASSIPNVFSSCTGISANNAYRSFGNTSDTGCKDEPWNVAVDFLCPYGSTAMIQRGQAGINWNYIDANFYPGVPYVCVAQPKVYVLDNWGWCASRPPANGGCTQNSRVVGNGCYSEAGNSGNTNQCNSSAFLEPWVHYNGRIIIVPFVETR